MTAPNANNSKSIADKIAGECLSVRIRLLGRTISRIYDDALQPLGLTSGQMNILVVVAKFGQLSSKDISRRLNMEKSTVSRNIDLMCRKGWLNECQERHKRSRIVEISEEGSELLVKSLPGWKKTQEQVRDLLGSSGVSCIHRVADTVWVKLRQR